MEKQYKIKEGKASVHVYTGKIDKSLPVFYNPEMENQRNITVAVLYAYQKSVDRAL